MKWKGRQRPAGLSGSALGVRGSRAVDGQVFKAIYSPLYIGAYFCQ